MIVGIYNKNQIGGNPVGTISLNKAGKIKVESVHKDIKEFFKVYITRTYGLPANSIAYPEDPERWVEDLPNGHHSIPYYFILQTKTESIEEEIDDIEEDNEEDYIEEGDTEEESSDEDGDSEDGGDDTN